ncbi:hypothetical protein [Argonema antarcticum]|uniref:hypothetical protein n=1 Tax=Argonema antarcticum TaxID=2942763 RepID=UPI002012ACFC|nr:hypothetical protein [Argonema antarcticum]MCL1469951.1 hypothetical protein [Argonema antarcticum A004/B2]
MQRLTYVVIGQLSVVSCYSLSSPPPLSHSPTLPLPHSPTLPLPHSPTPPLSRNAARIVKTQEPCAIGYFIATDESVKP